MQKIKIQITDYKLVSVIKIREILLNFTTLKNQEAFTQAKQLCKGEAIIVPNDAFLAILECVQKNLKLA